MSSSIGRMASHCWSTLIVLQPSMYGTARMTLLIGSVNSMRDAPSDASGSSMNRMGRVAARREKICCGLCQTKSHRKCEWTTIDVDGRASAAVPTVETSRDVAEFSDDGDFCNARGFFILVEIAIHVPLAWSTGSRHCEIQGRCHRLDGLNAHQPIGCTGTEGLRLCAFVARKNMATKTQRR